MKELLEQQLHRYREIQAMMLDPEVLSDGARVSKLAREQGALAKVATAYGEFKDLNRQVAEARAMIDGDDPDMRELAEEELPELERRREQCWNELLDLTVGGEDAARTSCVMEIRAGTGGDEAALFSRDLFEMYRRYCEDQGWKFEVLEMSPTELGGFKEVIIGIEGQGCYLKLQYESGVHRVQRVPETEAKGRVHTSASTVAVMAEPEDVEIDLSPDDYREDIFCASGPGGQHVNKTASAIRLTHYETNIVVSCQDEKSQHKNRAKALRVLKTRLYDHFRQIEDNKRSAERKSLVGSGDRSGKIRTYNFPENRLTDHRINFTIYKLEQVLAGHVDLVVEALLEYERQQHREAVGTAD
jgi:peptide chain release factor 1